MKNILSLNYEEAKAFFLKNESYINVDLPPYITFDTLLTKISDKLAGKSYRVIKRKNPDKLENINYKLLHNKNGKYDWRPFELIHPVLYVSLVNQITKYHKWKEIKKRFGTIRGRSVVQCMSLPIVSESDKSDKAEQVLNWWQEIEQKSLELSLEFSYLYHTDITDCYGSIYTHSIPWALHSKSIAKVNKSNKLIGNVIDDHIRAMSFAQTNGIPQGSVLIDFIAEIVLNYADLQLSKKVLQKYDRVDFKILRYRDDYRIFVNNPSIAEDIIKILTEVLIDLGLKLHPHKTISHSNVILGSVKPDKIDWMMGKRSAITIQKQLLILYKFACNHPNSGSLMKALQTIFNKLDKKTNTQAKRDHFVKQENPQVLISIVVDIAYHNPRTYSIASAILSKLFSLIGNEDKIRKIVLKVLNKFKTIPNTGHMQIWLQRSIVKLPNTQEYFDENICKLVLGEEVELWNNDWLHAGIVTIFNNNPVIDHEKLETIDEVIDSDEVLLFGLQSL